MKQIMYCCYRFNRNGVKEYDETTMRLFRKQSISALTKWSDMSWKAIKKAGWHCEKVLVTIEPAKLERK